MEWNEFSKDHYQQMSLFPEEEFIPDPRQSQTVMWNNWHGCTKVSPGCLHCYMYRRDESNGVDPSVVKKTKNQGSNPGFCL